jgi:hypothetical protein
MRETGRVLETLDLDAELGAAKREIADRLENDVAPPEVGSGGEVSGEVMEAYLQQVRGFLEEVLRQEAEAFSPGAWIWYLRNSPPELLTGGGKTKYFHPAAIAEAASASGTKRQDPRGAGWDALAYEISELTVKQIARFSAISHLLLFTQQRIRLNRRGAEWKMEGPWPQKSLPEEVASALDRYDERNAAAENQFFNRSGTVLAQRLEGEVRGAPDETALSVLPIGEPGLFPLALGSSEFGEPIYSTHAVLPVLLHRLREFNRSIGEHWWRESAPATLTLLIALFPVVREDRDLLRELQATGLWITHPDEFGVRVERTLQRAGELAREVLLGAEVPASPEQLLEALESIRGRLWPVEAHQVVRREDESIAFDLAAASRALDCAFEFSSRPETSERDKDFEKAIQWAVDSSDWKPEGELAQMPGRQLKIDDQFVAEVDAVAAKRSVLVVVDGRGTAYTHAFETGERNAVKSAMNQVEKKVTAMQRRLEILRNTPKGDNYDFSGYEILGTVVTAVPIYTFHPDSHATEKDLPAVVSLGELLAWLETH